MDFLKKLRQPHPLGAVRAPTRRRRGGRTESIVLGTSPFREIGTGRATCRKSSTFKRRYTEVEMELRWPRMSPISLVEAPFRSNRSARACRRQRNPAAFKVTPAAWLARRNVLDIPGRLNGAMGARQRKKIWRQGAAGRARR